LCRGNGIVLPQLKVRASVLRTAAVDGGPRIAAWGPGLALRKRLDGGFTIAQGTVISDIVPDSFHFFTPFLPALRMERKGISLKFGKRFFEEWRTARPRPLDAPSPYEEVRVLDPIPEARDLVGVRETLERTFPMFKGVPTAERWAGYIDVTPDILPVISPVDAVPGLFLSTGFSGHGFGIGPGAGKLTADLVSGVHPIVDPTPFRFSRFTDGSDLRPLSGL
jgi:glycine/D-amino acid oxidase-like deaminating enzyme